MRARIRLGLAVAAATLLPGPLQAQHAPTAELQVTDTVRVSWTDARSRPARTEGVVTYVAADSLVLDTDGGRLTIPAGAVTSVQVGHSRSPWGGFKRGFAVGALVLGLPAAVVGAAAGSSCEGDLACPGPGAGAAVLGVFFGVGGGLVIGLAKTTSPGVEWREVPVRVTAGPAPGGGTELLLRVSF